jgi:hypothetical protein
VLEADIEACFDDIDYTALMGRSRVEPLTAKAMPPFSLGTAPMMAPVAGD